MNSSAAYVFYDIHMGAAHRALEEILATKKKGSLASNEVAVFLSTNCRAVKILCPSNVIIYYRSQWPLTAMAIKTIPNALGGSAFKFQGSLEAKLLKHLEKTNPGGAHNIKAMEA